MKTLTLTIEVDCLGVDLKSSPLAEELLRTMQKRLGEHLTPEFVAYCLYLVAKKQTRSPKRPKGANPLPRSTAGNSPEVSFDEK